MASTEIELKRTNENEKTQSVSETEAKTDDSQPEHVLDSICHLASDIVLSGADQQQDDTSQIIYQKPRREPSWAISCCSEDSLLDIVAFSSDDALPSSIICRKTTLFWLPRVTSITATFQVPQVPSMSAHFRVPQAPRMSAHFRLPQAPRMSVFHKFPEL